MTTPAGENKVIKYSYETEGKSVDKNKMKLSKELNISLDDDLIKSKGQGDKYDATVTSIKYQDGTETKMLETLPE